jgi:hypothetical protein
MYKGRKIRTLVKNEKRIRGFIFVKQGFYLSNRFDQIF